jgi:mannose-6-phosphate isomerase-like protein (cupin superfamily)
MTTLDARALPSAHDVLAPDGSEIRLLGATARASMVHCTLPPGRTTLAVRHRTVEEIWYVVAGRGEVWRRLGDAETTVEALPGVSLTIPTGAHFQFRATGDAPLQIIIATMPPWPGADEAVRVADHWPVADDPVAAHDPEAVRAGIRAAAGMLTAEESERLKQAIYRARVEGTRPE